MDNVQQKINMALAAINYMTNTLDMVNTQMAMIPSTGIYAQKFQDDRVKFHTETLEKITAIANEIGDFLNDSDAYEEKELNFINPIFDFINGNDEELD